MLKLLDVASNPAVLKTREGLNWLIGYSRAICDESSSCNLSFEQVMESLQWDMDNVLDDLMKGTLPLLAPRYTASELPF